MSTSVPGAPGVSIVRRSMLRERTARQPATPPKRKKVVASNGGRLGELAEALTRVQEVTGLGSRELATRLVEQLDPASPIRPIDIFASGRSDLVTAYLEGELDGAAVLAAWRPTDS